MAKVLIFGDAVANAQLVVQIVNYSSLCDGSNIMYAIFVDLSYVVFTHAC
jgi:hypothetical protein